jgi:hypothetical protein
MTSWSQLWALIYTLPSFSRGCDYEGPSSSGMWRSGPFPIWQLSFLIGMAYSSSHAFGVFCWCRLAHCGCLFHWFGS